MAVYSGILSILLLLLCKISNSEVQAEGGNVNGESVNSGSLLLQAGSNLTIDTSAPGANVSVEGYVTSYNMSLTHHNFTDLNGKTWKYSVAHLDVHGNITLASRVIIRGRHALSVRSISGNIVVSTTLSMTCGTTDVFNGMCLGGFRPQNSTKFASDYNNANGPSRVEKVDDSYSRPCLPGAGHGGKGGMSRNSSSKYDGWHYGRNDSSLLLGGTSGLFHRDNTDYGHAGAGGGAIELIANNGSITIEREMFANAQGGTSGTQTQRYFAGSSGGLIRLKAAEVNIQATAKLQVVGSNSSSQQPSRVRPAAEGGGGIIQIIAPNGKICVGSQISLRNGIPHNKACDTFAEDGYLEIGGFFRDITKELNLTDDLCWNENKKITCPTHSPSTVPPSTSVVGSSSTQATVSQTIELERLLGSIEKMEVDTSTIDLEDMLRKLQHILNEGSLEKSSIEVLVHIYKAFGRILRNFMKANVKLKQEDLTQLLDIADQSLAEKNNKGWEEYRKLTKFIEALEVITLPFAEGGNSTSYGDIHYYTHHIAVQVTTVKTKRFGDYVLPSHEITRSSWKDLTDKIVLPHDFIASPEDNITFVVILSKGLRAWTPVVQGSTQSSELDYEINSNILSLMAIRGGERVTKLVRPAELFFKQQDSNGSNASCNFWNEAESRWSTEGVTTVSSTAGGKAVCSTSHLTSFAVLMQFVPIKLTNEEKFSLSMITYIGCGLSIICLILTLIVFIFVDSLSNERHKIHMNLAIAVLLTQALFISSNKTSQLEMLCRILAVFQHYFASTVFTWMCIEGIHLYIKVVNVFGTEGIKMKYYYSFGWGLPVLWVGVAAIAKPEGYGNFNNVCWLSLDNDFIWIFLGPVVAIIAMNIIVMVMVVRIVVVSASANKSSSFAHVKTGIKGIFVLLPILGLSWAFGLLMVGQTAKVFVYLFTIANSFQGVFIFLLYCVGNTEIRASFRRMRERRALTKSGDYNASFSASNDDSRSGKGSNSDKSMGLGKIKEKFAKHPTKTKVVHIKPTRQNSRKTSFHINRTVEQSLSPPITPEARMSLHTPENEIEEIVLPDNAVQPKMVYNTKSRRLRKS